MAIRSEMVAEPVMASTRLNSIHPNYSVSARNLLHYLILRRRDLRPLQRRLAKVGLSSLGLAESQVLAAVDAVLEILHRLARKPRHPPARKHTHLEARLQTRRARNP
ncbi:MAG: hypothetical protein LV473_04570 [Nitrospira sp.]|nr:hypothetical protein [Nitrospira sp.]